MEPAHPQTSATAKAVAAGQPGAPLGARDVVGGGVWTVGERIVSQGAQLLLLVAAARILGPAEFGVFALVSAVAFVLARTAEAGWGQFILAWPGDAHVPRQVLTLAGVVGLGAAFPCLAVAGLLAALGATQSAAPLAALFALWLPLAVISAPQRAIVQWQGRLIAMSLCEIAAELIGLAVALLALWADQGVLALAYGKIAMQIAYLALTGAVTRLPPAASLKGAPLRDILAVAWRIVLARGTNTLGGYVATFIVGGFLGPAAVGWYRAAERLTGAVGEVIGVPSERLAWSMLRDARTLGGVGSPAWIGTWRVWLVATHAIGLPTLAWVALLGGDLIVLLLGPDWLPALPAIVLLALSRMAVLPTYGMEANLTLAGNVARMTPLVLASLALSVGATLAAAPFGLVPVAAAQVAANLAAGALTLEWAARHGGVPRREMAGPLARVAIAAALGTAALAWLAAAPFAAQWPAVARAFALPFLALPAYLAALALLVPEARRAAALLRRSGTAQAS